MYLTSVYTLYQCMQKLVRETIFILALCGSIWGWECNSKTNFDCFNGKLQPKRSLKRHPTDCLMVSEEWKRTKRVKKDINFTKDDTKNITSLKSRWFIE